MRSDRAHRLCPDKVVKCLTRNGGQSNPLGQFDPTIIIEYCEGATPSAWFRCSMEQMDGVGRSMYRCPRKR